MKNLCGILIALEWMPECLNNLDIGISLYFLMLIKHLDSSENGDVYATGLNDFGQLGILEAGNHSTVCFLNICPLLTFQLLYQLNVPVTFEFPKLIAFLSSLVLMLCSASQTNSLFSFSFLRELVTCIILCFIVNFYLKLSVLPMKMLFWYHLLFFLEIWRSIPLMIFPSPYSLSINIFVGW